MAYVPEFILFVAIAAFTPGPNNIMLMSSGANFGVRASIPHLLGICLGVPVLILALGLGAGLVFQQLAWLHQVIRVIGVIYLIYLAYRIATSAPLETGTVNARPLSFFESALFQWVNPKTWMMGTSAIATYTSSNVDMAPQIAMVVLVFFLFTWPSAGIWLLFGKVLKRVLANPLHHRIFNWTMAALLLVSMRGVVGELYGYYL